MTEAEGERYRLVRIFPDFGDSPIWFADAYPFDYAKSGISAELRVSFEEWEQFFYEHVGYGTKRLPGRLAEYDDHGQQLAQRLADEIGPGFQVEFRRESTGARLSAIASGPASNEVAAAAFVKIREDSRADDLALAALRAEGPERGISLGWSAHAPNTGEDFSNPS